jgi:hypothetical protein
MTREQAEALAAKLAAEHPERETHHWRPRELADGGWDVVKIALPAVRDEELTAETAADERPPTGEDPRGPTREVPPWSAGV